VSDRMNKTLVEKVRCMLSNAELGREFWAEALTYVLKMVAAPPRHVFDEDIYVQFMYISFCFKNVLDNV